MPTITYTTTTAMQESIKTKLVAGVVTNYGTFTHFDEYGTAHFKTVNGGARVGRLALHIVQLR